MSLCHSAADEKIYTSGIVESDGAGTGNICMTNDVEKNNTKNE